MFKLYIASCANNSRGPPCGTITSCLRTSLNATAYPWQDADTSRKQPPPRRTCPPAPEQYPGRRTRHETPQPLVAVPGFGPLGQRPAQDSPASVQPSQTGPRKRPYQDLLCVYPTRLPYTICSGTICAHQPPTPTPHPPENEVPSLLCPLPLFQEIINCNMYLSLLDFTAQAVLYLASLIPTSLI